MIQGCVDVIDGRRVCGWAFVAQSPEDRLTIEIGALGERLGIVCADRFRPDLLKAGLGDGGHAFEFNTDWPLPPWVADRIDVSATSSSGETIILRRGEGLPPRAKSDGSLTGNYEAVDPFKLSGWAFDASEPDRRMEIVVIVDGQEAGRVMADVFRDDLKSTGIGDGSHAFVFRSQTSLPIDTSDSILVRAIGASGERVLPRLARSATPLSEPVGARDSDLKWVKWRIGGEVETFILQTFANYKKNDVFFVQVGANDGTMGDPLVNFIKKEQWKGILIEPVAVFFDRLRANYAGQPGLEFAQTACGDVAGRLPFHQVRNVDRLPVAHMQGLSSFNKEIIRSHFDSDAQFLEFTEEVQIDVVTLDSLLEARGITRLDLVLIDTEGADLRVLRGFDVQRFRPDLVIIEHYHLSPPDLEALHSVMHEAGYERVTLHMDTCFFRNGIFRNDEADLLANFRNPLISWL